MKIKKDNIKYEFYGCQSYLSFLKGMMSPFLFLCRLLFKLKYENRGDSDYNLIILRSTFLYRTTDLIKS